MEAAENTLSRDPVMTRTETANYLGISEVTLWRLIRDGEYPPLIKVSPMRRVSRRSIADAYLARKTAEAARQK